MFTFTLQYTEAVKLAKKLAHSMSREETRYYLKGFFLGKADGTHYAVSTDGHLLTRLEISPSYEAGEFPDVIFPAAAIKQLESLKPQDKAKAVVTISVDARHHAYEAVCDGQSFGGKLIDGTYPDWRRVIPAGYLSYTNEYGACGFNPLYLAAIGKAAAYDASTFTATKLPNPIRLFFQDGSPAVVREQNDLSTLYVIMPMRSSLPKHQHKAAAAEPGSAELAA